MARSIELARVFYRVEAETKGLEGQLKGAERSLERLGKFILDNPVAAAGAMGVALIGIGLKAAEMAEKVTHSMRLVQASMKVTSGELQGLTGDLENLSKQTGRTQADLAAMAQLVAGNGVSSIAELRAVLAAGTEAADATGGDLAGILGNLDTVLDAFKINGADAEKVLAKLFVTAQGKTNLPELLGVFDRLSPVVQAVGVDFETTAAAVTTLINRGYTLKQIVADLGQLDFKGFQDLAAESRNASDGIKELRDQATLMRTSVENDGARLAAQWDAVMIRFGNSTSHAKEILRPFLEDLLAVSERLVLGPKLFTGGEPGLPMNGRNPNNLPPLPPKPTPEQLKAIAEQKKLADELIAELRQKVAEFTATAVDDSVLALDRFLADMNEKLAKLTVAERAAAQPLIDLVAAGMRANTEFLRAVEAIKTTPTVIAKAAAPIALRTEGKSPAQVAQDLKEAEKEAAKAQKQAMQDAQMQAQAIAQAAHGALQLADAFGVMSDNAAQALESVVQIASSASQFAALSKNGASFTQLLPSILSIAGGLGSLVSSLFGESPEQKRAREVQQSNTEAILELSQKIGDLGGRLSGVAGSTVLGVGEAAKAAAGTFGFGLFNNKDLAILQGQLGKLGLTMGDLKEVAAGLGISFAGAVPNATELKQLVDAIAASELATFSQSFSGQLAYLEGLFQIDLTTPIDQLTQLVDLFRDPKFGSPALRKALAGLDLSTPEGRAAAEKAVEELYKRLAKPPDQGGLSAADLGGMSPEEFRQALLDLEKRMQDIANGATDAGQASQFAVQRTITEVQANLLASLLTTGNVWAEMTARNTAAIVAALGASLPTGSIVPPATSTAAAGNTYLDVTLYLTLPAMVDPAAGMALGGSIADGLAAKLDAQYGATLRTRKLLSGNVTQV